MAGGGWVVGGIGTKARARQQAGAEMCQAQEKLGPARNCGGLPFKMTLRYSSIIKKLKSSYVCLKIEVIFHLLTKPFS